jgi:transposase-like protein
MKGAYAMSRGKYQVGLKKKIVQKYLAGEQSVKSLAKQYGVGVSSIKEWIVLYRHNGITALESEKQNHVYSEEIKRKAVKEYLSGKGSTITITAKYGMRSTVQLRNWIKEYNSGRGFRRKISGGSRMKEARPTTVEERIQIAKDCIANGGNYGETALKFNVSYQQVYQWVKKYKEMGTAGLEDRRGKRKKDQTPRTELEKAQIEIERLKHELYMTQMERDLLKKLDEIERREAYRK